MDCSPWKISLVEPGESTISPRGPFIARQRGTVFFSVPVLIGLQPQISTSEHTTVNLCWFQNKRWVFHIFVSYICYICGLMSLQPYQQLCQVTRHARTNNEPAHVWFIISLGWLDRKWVGLNTVIWLLKPLEVWWSFWRQHAKVKDAWWKGEERPTVEIANILVIEPFYVFFLVTQIKSELKFGFIGQICACVQGIWLQFTSGLCLGTDWCYNCTRAPLTFSRKSHKKYEISSDQLNTFEMHDGCKSQWWHVWLIVFVSVASPFPSSATLNMKKQKVRLRLMGLTTLTFSLGDGTRSKVRTPLMSALNLNGSPSNSCWYFSVCFQSGRMTCCPDACILCMCRFVESVSD